MLFMTPSSQVLESPTYPGRFTRESGPSALIPLGLAASMGSVLLAAGSPEKRAALPNSRIMIHQPWMGGVQGQASDIEIHAREILKMKQSLYDILAKHTGQTPKKIEEDGDRDYWMGAEEAKKYGLVDNVLKPQKKPKKKDDD